MEPEFWHEKWRRMETGFHEGVPNQGLVRYFDRLKTQPGARVFVPLCGKSADLVWLLDQGYRVVGVELSTLAVEQFFAETQMTPEVIRSEKLVTHTAPGIVVHQGDIFDITAEILGHVDAVYDRAALVALPEPMRQEYAAHLVSITKRAPQLLISFDYDPASMTGPPFSVTGEVIHALYDRSYECVRLDRSPIANLKTAREAFESVWLLKSRDDA